MGTATTLNTSRGMPKVFSSFGWTSKTCHLVQGSALCKAFSTFSASRTPSNCFTSSPDSTEKSSLKRAYFTRATVPALTVRETQAVLLGLSLMGRMMVIISFSPSTVFSIFHLLIFCNSLSHAFLRVVWYNVALIPATLTIAIIPMITAWAALLDVSFYIQSNLHNSNIFNFLSFCYDTSISYLYR
nr:MAG TPA: hypothetical protein [Caudoviricetes sp.]